MRMRKKYRIWPGDGDPRHGTRNGYVNLGCRCDACRAAWAEYFKTYRRRERRGLSADDPRHGKYSSYSNHGCRCNACRKAWTTYQRGYRARTSTQTFPATPALWRGGVEADSTGQHRPLGWPVLSE